MTSKMIKSSDKAGGREGKMEMEGRKHTNGVAIDDALHLLLSSCGNHCRLRASEKTSEYRSYFEERCVRRVFEQEELVELSTILVDDAGYI